MMTGATDSSKETRIARPLGFLAGSWLVLFAAQSVGAAEEYNPVLRRQPIAQSAPAQRIIVKFRSAAAAARGESQAEPADERVRSLAARMNLRVSRTRRIASDLHLMQIAPQPPGESVGATLARLRTDSSVEYAEPDRIRHAHALSNDPLAPNQWYLQNAQPAAVDATTTWDTTTGSNGVVIAVIDTGVRFEHPDLRNAIGNRLLPGYDFIAADPEGSLFVANDGDGRDADASDPGDWVSDSDLATAPISDCAPTSSTWHGTRVAGMIGALTNNAAGVAGLSWRTWILPVRALGRCAGYDSDILTAMRWAAGLHVDGVPDNPYPAKVENLSFGSIGPCSPVQQTVIDELTAKGVLLIASAGNEGGPVDAPANCRGVVGVAGLRHAGTKVGFSNQGPQIALSAPAGNCGIIGPGESCMFPLDTTANDGLTIPGNSIYTDQLNANLGTSFSAPIVAGISALMLAVNGNLRPLQLTARLREGAKPFPVSTDPQVPECRVLEGENDVQALECNCTEATCGAGMANASGAVKAALRPIAAVRLPSVVAPGQDIVLSGSGSAAACGRSLIDYSWTVVDEGSAGPTAITGANTPTAVVVVPTSGSLSVRLTVTDNVGRKDTADVTVRPGTATSTAPATAGTTACLSEINFTLQPESSASGGGGSSSGSGADGGGSSAGGSGGGGGAIAMPSLLVLLYCIARRRNAGVRRDRPSRNGASSPERRAACFSQPPSRRSAVSSQAFCARR